LYIFAQKRYRKKALSRNSHYRRTITNQNIVLSYFYRFVEYIEFNALIAKIRQITKISKIKYYSAFQLLSKTLSNCCILKKIKYIKDRQEEKKNKKFDLSI